MCKNKLLRIKINQEHYTTIITLAVPTAIKLGSSFIVFLL